MSKIEEVKKILEEYFWKTGSYPPSTKEYRSKQYEVLASQICQLLEPTPKKEEKDGQRT